MKPAKRQSTPPEKGIVNLKEGDRLWKLWHTNEHDGFRMKLISVLRSNGGLELVVISKGPSGKQWGSEKPESDGALVRAANDWVKEMSDEHLQFKFLDLSGIETFDEQIEVLKREGFNISEPRCGFRRTGDL